MAQYEIQDSQTGDILTIEGDSPPTEQEMAELFGAPAPDPMANVQPNIYDTLKEQSGGRGPYDPGTEFTALMPGAVLQASELVGRGLHAVMQPFEVAAANLGNIFQNTQPMAWQRQPDGSIAHPEVQPNVGMIPMPPESARGIGPSLQRAAFGLTTPGSIATLPVAITSRPIMGAFALGAASGIPPAVQAFAQSQSPAEARGALTDLAISSAFTRLMGRGALRKRTPAPPMGERIAEPVRLEPIQERYDARIAELGEKQRALGFLDESEQSELATLRKERDAQGFSLAPEEQAFLDAARESIDVPIEVRPGVTVIQEGDPFARQKRAEGGRLEGEFMRPNYEKRTIEVFPEKYQEWLRGVPPERRAQAVKSRIAEERIHLDVDDAAASAFMRYMTGAEKRIWERIYFGEWGRPKGYSETQVGHEALRYRIQQLRGMTPSEIAEAALRERWTVKGLSILESAIRGVRETLGTKASREQQAILERVQQGITFAKGVVTGDEPAARMRRNDQYTGDEMFDTRGVRAAGGFARMREAADDPRVVAQADRQKRQDAMASLLEREASKEPGGFDNPAARMKRGSRELPEEVEVKVFDKPNENLETEASEHLIDQLEDAGFKLSELRHQWYDLLDWRKQRDVENATLFHESRIKSDLMGRGWGDEEINKAVEYINEQKNIDRLQSLVQQGDVWSYTGYVNENYTSKGARFAQNHDYFEMAVQLKREPEVTTTKEYRTGERDLFGDVIETRKESNLPKSQFTGQHAPFPDDTIVHGRGWLANSKELQEWNPGLKLPEGDTALVMEEAQSDWLNSYKKDQQPRQSAFGENRIPNHKLLEQANRMIVAAMMQRAKAKGAKWIVIPDSPTVAMTQGHDLMPRTLKAIEPSQEAALETGIKAEAILGKPTQGAGVMVEQKGNRWEVSIIPPPSPKLLRKLRRELGKFQISHERGHIQNYDKALPDIVENITGSSPVRVSLGEHERAIERHGYYAGSPSGEAPGGGLKTTPRENLIFENPDGTPKTDASGLMFRIDEGGDAPAARIKGGLSKKAQEKIEAHHRLMAARLEAEGAEVPDYMKPAKYGGEAVPAEERTGTGFEYEAVTPKAVDELVAAHLSGPRPSYDDAFAAAKAQFGPKVERGALRDAWFDQLEKILLESPGERIKELVNELKVRPQVIGPERATSPARELNVIDPPKEGYKPSRGAERLRNRAITAIWEKLHRESEGGRSLNRDIIDPDEIRWSRGEEAYQAVPAELLGDPAIIGEMLTKGGRTDATTREAIAGGQKIQKRAALPESATRRVTVMVDDKGRVHLVSTYKHGRQGPVMVDPGSFKGHHRPVADVLKRYRPIQTMLLDEPVQNFHKVYKNLTEYNAEFGNAAKERSEAAGYGVYGAEPTDVTPEGTPGIRDMERPGTLETDARLTIPETRALYGMFGDAETIAEAKSQFDHLAWKARNKKLTARDRMAISALNKAYKYHSKRGLDLTEGQLIDLTIDEIYGNAKFSEESTSPRGEFINRTTRQLEGERPIPAEPQRASKTARTLYAPREAARIAGVGKGLRESIQGGQLAREMAAMRAARQRARDLGESIRETPIEPTAQELAGQKMRREMYDELAQPPRTAAEELAQRLKDIKETSRMREQVERSAKRERGIATNEGERALEQDVTEGLIEEGIERGADERADLGDAPAARMKRKSERIRDAILNVGTAYDEHMVERLARRGGPLAQAASEGFGIMIYRAKELYGSLTPDLDKARMAAGASKQSGVPGLGQRPTLEGLRATTWLNGRRNITPAAATSNFFDAMELTAAIKNQPPGPVALPPWMSKLTIPAHVKGTLDKLFLSNLQAGKMIESVTPGFKAGGKPQRNLSAIGVDAIRGGKNELLHNWVIGTAKANKAPVALVEGMFGKLKAALDEPTLDPTKVDHINQDFARKLPVAITHVKSGGQWHEVVHARPFNYIENVAQRAAHIKAFREQFPNDKSGRALLASVMDGLRKELDATGQADLEALMRTMQGHPTDNYNAAGPLSPTNPIGGAVRSFNATVGNVLSKMVLTGQMLTQAGEVAAGATPQLLGVRNYLRGMARVRQLYPELELRGDVNRVIYDLSWDPNSPLQSTARLTGNALSKGFAQQALNELQEAAAAATARVVSERIQAGTLTKWERRALPQTFKAMGFSQAEVGLAMAGDTQVLAQFERKASSFLTGGNKALAEGSKLGANRLFNSIFRFQLYPMTKTNQLRKLARGFDDAWLKGGSPTEKAASAEALGRFVAGGTLQGAITVAIMALGYTGLSGLKIKKEEALDEPLKFLGESFAATMSGPLYLLWRGGRDKGVIGYGEQATRMVFPYAIARELIDMAGGHGAYKDRPTFDRIGRFISNKTPGTKAISTGLAMFGLASESRELDTAISAFYRWRKSELGFREDESFLKEDERKNFRVEMRKVVDALKSGDEKKFDAAMEAAKDAVPEGNKPSRSFAASLRARKLLRTPDGKELSDEQMDKLTERIGGDAVERLMFYDEMLEAAARGQFIQP